MKVETQLLEDAIRAELWARGDLREEMYPNSQLVLFEMLESWRKEHAGDMGPAVLNCHRGMGKSFFLAQYGIHRCLKKGGTVVRFGSPTLTQTEEIAVPIMTKILNDAPRAISWRKVANNYFFRSPLHNRKDGESVFNLFSCKEDAESMRGKRAHVVLLDEVRSIQNAQYVIEEVLLFLFAGQEDPMMVLSSTPPKRPDHAFTSYFIPGAKVDGRYFEMSIDKNPDFPAVQRQMLAKVCGGVDTIGWKREALCMTLPDPSALAVSEFIAARSEIVKVTELPTHYFAFLGMDAGFMDYTACLFAWVEFIQQKLVIEDEYVTHYRSTLDIATEIKKKEAALFGESVHHERIRRYADANQQQLHDLRSIYGLPFSAASRWEMDAALADLKAAIQMRDIWIHPRCRNLIHQLEHSTLNNRRNDFDRPEEMEFGHDPTRPIIGHSDALMALVYLWRQMKHKMLENPYPTPQQVFKSMPGTIVDLPEEKPGKLSKYGLPRKGVVTSRNVVTNNPIRIQRRKITVWSGQTGTTGPVPIRKVISPDGRSTWIYSE